MEQRKRFDELPDILSVGEVAAYLGLGSSAIYTAIREKTIPAVRIGKRILIPRSGIRQIVGDAGRAVELSVDDILPRRRVKHPPQRRIDRNGDRQEASERTAERTRIIDEWIRREAR